MIEKNIIFSTTNCYFSSLPVCTKDGATYPSINTNDKRRRSEKVDPSHEISVLFLPVVTGWSAIFLKVPKCGQPVKLKPMNNQFLCMCPPFSPVRKNVSMNCQF